MTNLSIHEDRGVCYCGKLLTFRSEDDALAFRSISTKRFTHAHICNSNTGYWHLSTHGAGKLKNLERELHEEMANNPKTIRQRITDYMWDSYQRNKTTEFSSQMVIFAVQQEYPSAKKPNIMQEISKAKKDGAIVSLKKPVPDQRGAVYFTLSRILEAETEPDNVTETVKAEVPTQSKPIPVNPFEAVNKKLDDLKGILGNSEITLDKEDFDKLASRIEAKLNISNAQILKELQELKTDTRHIKEIASTHVTVDGDRLADVINARLGNLKLEDSFIHKVTYSTDLLTERMQRMADTLAELKGVPSTVSNSSDYRAGVKDGIRMALEMGLKIDES